MNHYMYIGPVINNFNQIIKNKWEGETYANTDRKAMSNLNYQFKKEHGLLKSAKVVLINEIVKS